MLCNSSEWNKSKAKSAFDCSGGNLISWLLMAIGLLSLFFFRELHGWTNQVLSTKETVKYLALKANTEHSVIPPKETFLLTVGSVYFGFNEEKKRNSHWKFFSFESFRSLIRKVYRVREEISINSIKRFRNWFREEASIGEDFILNPHPRLLDQLRCVASVNKLIFFRNNGLSSDATYLNIFF